MGEVPLYVRDRFVETYYSDRWYNSYEIHDHESDLIKCWYCNVTYPAKLGVRTITFHDLALDLLVYPDGRQQVLDESEFDALGIPPDDKKSALATLDDLRRLFQKQLEK